MTSQRKMANSQKNKRSVPRQKARAQRRSAGAGEYFHIEVLPRTDFINFQTQTVGPRGRIQRVAGQRSSGYWSTVKWLIDKNDAHIQDNKLVPDTLAAKNVMEQLGSEPVRMLGDLFKARPQPSFRREEKPTRSPTRTRRESTKKSQAGRRKN